MNFYLRSLYNYFIHTLTCSCIPIHLLIKSLAYFPSYPPSILLTWSITEGGGGGGGGVDKNDLFTYSSLCMAGSQLLFFIYTTYLLYHVSVRLLHFTYSLTWSPINLPLDTHLHMNSFCTLKLTHIAKSQYINMLFDFNDQLVSLHSHLLTHFDNQVIIYFQFTHL